MCCQITRNCGSRIRFSSCAVAVTEIVRPWRELFSPLPIRVAVGRSLVWFRSPAQEAYAMGSSPVVRCEVVVGYLAQLNGVECFDY